MGWEVEVVYVGEQDSCPACVWIDRIIYLGAVFALAFSDGLANMLYMHVSREERVFVKAIFPENNQHCRDWQLGKGDTL